MNPGARERGGERKSRRTAASGGKMEDKIEVVSVSRGRNTIGTNVHLPTVHVYMYDVVNLIKEGT